MFSGALRMPLSHSRGLEFHSWLDACLQLDANAPEEPTVMVFPDVLADSWIVDEAAEDWSQYTYRDDDKRQLNLQRHNPRSGLYIFL